MGKTNTVNQIKGVLGSPTGSFKVIVVSKNGVIRIKKVVRLKNKTE